MIFGLFWIRGVTLSHPWEHSFLNDDYTRWNWGRELQSRLLSTENWVSHWIEFLEYANTLKCKYKQSEHDSKAKLTDELLRTEEEKLPQVGVDSTGKRWGYLAFMASSASQVAPSTDWLLHKTLAEATSSFLNLLTWRSNINYYILIIKTIFHRDFF